MSIQVMSWAFQQTLQPGPKLLLLALGDNADDYGRCWPSIKLLAAKASISVSTCRRYLAELERTGIIAKQKRVSSKTKRDTTNIYTINWGALSHQPVAPLTADNDAEDEQARGCQFDTPNNTGDEPEPLVEPQKARGCQSETPIPAGVSNWQGEGVTGDTPFNHHINPTTPNNAQGSVFDRVLDTAPTTGQPISVHWQPPAMFEAELLRAGIPPWFADEQLAEFRLYWVERGTPAPSWSAKFLNHLARQWPRHQAHQHRHQQIEQALNVKTERTVADINANTPRTTSDRLTDTAWADVLDI